MNVLILTPGRVGSTPLQRVMTMHMINNDFDKPVINFHDLLHGIEQYRHPDLNMHVLGKKGAVLDERDLTQSLSEITELLKNTDHYKVARIAYYGVVKREDPINEQRKFYEYLNKNFFVVRCEREDLFEFALSWIISNQTKQLNVDTPELKHSAYSEIYKSGVAVTKDQLFERLQDYQDFINWSDDHFNIDAHFNYETSIDNLEQFIMDLEFIPNDSKTWNELFGITFTDWNRCHKIAGDRNLVQITKEDLEFAKVNEQAYNAVYDHINDAARMKLLPANIPIKLQSFEEKKLLVSNFEECVVWFNSWLN